MEKEKLKGRVMELIEENRKEVVYLLKHVCFYSKNCDIRECRSEDYNRNRGTGTCCRFYEDKCKITIESLLKNI
jgi:hypothetical protein